MTQAQFMRNVRMSLPQYVTNVTSFADTVKILKNKAILTEADTNNKTPYSRFSEVDNLNSQEVLIGIDCERQKNTELSKEAATKIVIKNLKKNPNYYTMEYLSGVPSSEAEYMNKFKPGSDQMREFKGNDAVDKTNGMSTPKGVEKIKASANKANKETNKPESGIKLMTMVAKTVRGLKKMEPTGEKMKKLSLKENKEYNGFKVGDVVTVDEEAASVVGLEPNKEYTIKGFSEYDNSPGLPKSIDVILDKDKYNQTSLLYPAKGGVNIKYIKKVNETTSLPGGDNVTDVAGHQLNENEIDPTYTHFALNKNDNKIYNAWEYKDLDPIDIRYYTTMDLKDNDLKPSDFKILSIRGMKQKGIDPFDSKNWYSHETSLNEVKAGSLSVGDKFTLQGDLGIFIKGEEVEIYSVTPWGNDLKLVLSNGKDKDDFYVDKNDEL